MPDSRGRFALLNQLLLCGIIIVLAVLEFGFGESVHADLFLLGSLLVFVAAGATLLVPWQQFPAWVLIIVPLIDVVAIALLRVASPEAGYGILWVFPAMWLGSLGLVPLIVGSTFITFGYWALLWLTNTSFGLFTALVLPLVIVGSAVSSYTAARRHSAQQLLIERQTDVLTGTMRRAQRQEQLVTDVLDAVDFGIVRFSPAGEIVFVNDAVSQFSERAPSFGTVIDGQLALFEADGQTPIPPSERPYARLRRGEIFVDLVVWYGEPSARRIALSMTARRLLDESGADAGTVLIARDVTPELEARRARDELVTSVSHELRTPLTSILGYLDLAIHNPDLPASARGDLLIAERNGERITEIVADVLAASTSARLSIDMRLTKEVTEISQLLRRSIDEYAVVAGERAIVVDAAAVQTAHARVDPVRMRQVFDTLLANAVKFNRDGGLVTTTCHRAGDSVVVTVRDTGRGLSRAEQKRLFGRFFRGRAGAEGTGLGLSISRDIVRAHGGDLTVASVLGKESIFSVTFPSHPQSGVTEISAHGEEPRDA